MENIVNTNNTNLRLCELRVGLFNTLRVSLPMVSPDATNVQVLLTNGTITTAYSATKNTDGVWLCDVDAAQFSSFGKQKYEVAYKLDNKQFWDGQGWVNIVPATTSGIVPQPVPPPHRYAIVSITQGGETYYADENGNVVLPAGSGSGDIKHTDFADVTEIGSRYKESDMKNKINELIRLLKGTGVLCVAVALFAFAYAFGGVDVQKARKDDIYNDDLIVTNVLYTPDPKELCWKDNAVKTRDNTKTIGADDIGALSKEGGELSGALQVNRDSYNIRIDGITIRFNDEDGTAEGGTIGGYDGQGGGNLTLPNKDGVIAIVDDIPTSASEIGAMPISGGVFGGDIVLNDKYVYLDGEGDWQGSYLYKDHLQIKAPYGNGKTRYTYEQIEYDDNVLTFPEQSGTIAIESWQSLSRELQEAVKTRAASDEVGTNIMALIGSQVRDTFYTKAQADGKFATKQEVSVKMDAVTATNTFATKTEMSGKLDYTTAANTYATKSEVSAKLNSTDAANTYATKTELSGKVDASAAAATYATKTELSGKVDSTTAAATYATKTEVAGKIDKATADTYYAAKGDLTAKLDKTEAASTYATKTALADKADDSALTAEINRAQAAEALKADKTEIPTALPNPNALSIKMGNAVIASYDGSAARTANIPDIGDAAERLDYIEGYMAGNRVRVSVTNYYGNTSGDLPRLRIEEFVTETNFVGNVAQVTNYWRSIWDEQNKYDDFKAKVLADVSSMTNKLERWMYDLLYGEVNKKADRAWGKYTSAGEAAPPDVVWHSATKTVFAGGTEYAHAVCGSGVIAVLSAVGAPIYTDGSRGRFYFQTDDGSSYFGLNIQERYELPCDTDGIKVTPVGGENLVSLTYNVTTASKPILYYTPTLTPVAWEQLTDSTGAPVEGASIYASWESNPPAGSEICDLNGGSGVSGFFKAAIEFAGSSKFETNLSMDIQGGILATNISAGQSQPVEPYIQNGQVLWRIKQ